MRIKKSSQKLLKNNPRFQAVLLLEKILIQGGYSNVLLNKQLGQNYLTGPDKTLLVQLVYGVIQHWRTLEYYLSPYLKDRKLDDWVRLLLDVSVFQLEYLDRIPTHAVVNEAVKIAKIQGHQGLANFVNGVLRNYLRKGKARLEALDPAQRLSIQYSIDPSIIEVLADLLNPTELENFLASLLVQPALSLRINPKKGTRQQIMDDLAEEGIQTQVSSLSPYGIKVLSGDIFLSHAFEQGLVTVQDESSMLVAPLGQLTGQEIVLDPCSAPGGKATHIASLLDTGHLTALDISAHKLALVEQNAVRLGLKSLIDCQVADGRKFYPPEGLMYDRIYLDAPCSGLGLMRRKPEIKYHQIDDIVSELSRIQAELIDHLAQFLKPGGIFIYSTCTLTRAENERIIEEFLAKHDEFEIIPIDPDEVPLENFITAEGFVRIWPHISETDGFFIARLTKMIKEP